MYINSNLMLINNLNIKLKGQWENRKHWSRGRLTHQGQCCSTGNFICCLKWTRLLWSPIMLSGSVWLPKRGLFSSNSQNKNHYRNKIGRQDVCNQALIHANMQENAIRGGSELQECMPDDMQISFQQGQPPKVVNRLSAFLSRSSKLFGVEFININKRKGTSALKGWVGGSVMRWSNSSPGNTLAATTCSCLCCSESSALPRAGSVRQKLCLSCIFFLPWSAEGIEKNCCCC